MSTTALYVELLIIGIESSFGLYLIASGLGIDLFFAENFFPSSIGLLLFVGFVYIVGLFFDRISDFILSKQEINIRIKFDFSAKSVLLIDLSDRQQKYIDFVRSRIRILRGTTINSLFVSVCAVVYALLSNAKMHLILISMLVGFAVCWISFSSYKRLLNDFYEKLYLFEERLSSKTQQEV